MSRKPRGEAFAAVVQDLKAHPTPPPDPPPTTLDLGAESWRGPGGVIWHRESENVDAATARKFVQAGALVACDPCGCGGGCGLTWLDAKARARLTLTEPEVRPSKRDFGAITAWQDDKGQKLVVVQWPIRWGDDIG